MTAPSRTADEIIADWHAGRADHDPYDEIGGLVVEIVRLRADLADAERVRQDYEDERDEARTELAATEGGLGVAIREAAAARHALWAARPIIQGDYDATGDPEPREALRLVDAALDQRLTR